MYKRTPKQLSAYYHKDRLRRMKGTTDFNRKNLNEKISFYTVCVFLLFLSSSCFRDHEYDFYPVQKWSLDGVNISRYYSRILKHSVISDDISGAAQGCAFRGDTLYRFYDGGYCGVYYINSSFNLAHINEYELASYNDFNHMNCGQFDPSTGYLYSSELNRRICNVEALDNANNCSRLLQTITIERSKLLGDGYLNVICGDDGYLWAFGGPVDEEGVMHFFKFMKPSLSRKEVILSDQDVLDN